MTSARAKLLLIVTNLLSLACLVWVLHDINFGEVMEEIRDMRWGWVAVAVVADIGVYVIQGWRWSILLEPVSKIPFMQSVRAIYVGLFANEVLPLRSGEIIRCYLQSRWGSLPMSVTLSSALIERIFDGIWLVAYLGVVVQFVDVPKGIRDGGYLLMLMITILAAGLGWVMFFKEKAKRAAAGTRWAKHLNVLVDDLYAMSNSRSFYVSWLASLPHLLSMTIPVFAFLRAYRIDEISLGEAAAINVIIRLGTVIPGAPGNLGIYQALVVLALGLFGVDKSQAKRFSSMLWIIVTLPLLLAGFVALSVTGFKIRELQQEAVRAEAESKES